MRLPTRTHGDGQRPSRVRRVPQTGRRVQLLQRLRASLLRWVHGEVRASLPELRLKVGLAGLEKELPRLCAEFNFKAELRGDCHRVRIKKTVGGQEILKRSVLGGIVAILLIVSKYRAPRVF